jgi:hypothetical protein
MLYKVLFAQDKCLIPQSFNIIHVTNHQEEQKEDRPVAN